MNILLVAPQPFYQERGTPIAVRLLVETLCDFGHQVDLLVYHEGTEITVPGLRIVRAGRPPGVGAVPIGISWQKLVCDLWLVGRMLRLLRHGDYAVVHAVEEAVFPAAVMNTLSSRRLVYDMDSSLSDQLTDKWRLLRALRPLFRGIERWAVKRCAVVLPVCEDLAAKVRPWTTPERVIVLPDVPVGDGGVQANLDVLRAADESDAVLALYVGNLEHYQGIDLLLDGLARVPRELKLRTIVVGGQRGDVRRYQRCADELGLGEHVQFLGPRPVAHLNALLAQADVLLSPRILGQNTPMKVYSYMQSGKAILATNIRSHTQALDSTCAELVAPDPSALAAGLERLARDPSLRAQLGQAARARAESDYSLAAFRARLARAYALVGER